MKCLTTLNWIIEYQRKTLHVFLSKEIFIARMNLGRDGENISIGHKARVLLAVQEFQQHLCLHISSQEL